MTDESTNLLEGTRDAAQGGERGCGVFSFPEFLDPREQNHVFSDMVGTGELDRTLNRGEDAKRQHD